jgi:hypothetical protein
MNTARELFENDGEPLTESETRMLYAELDAANAAVERTRRLCARHQAKTTTGRTVDIGHGIWASRVLAALDGRELS